MEVRLLFINSSFILLFFCSAVLLFEDANALPDPRGGGVSAGGGGRGGGGGGRGGVGGGGGGKGGGVGGGRSAAYRYGGYGSYHGNGSGDRRRKGFYRGLAAGAALGAATILGLSMVLDGEVPDLNLLSVPLRQLVDIVNFIKGFKIPELEDILTKASCEAKAQWRDVTLSDDVSSLFGVKQLSIETVILVSMIDCSPSLIHATRAKYYMGVFSTSRLRDITEVMATMTETASLHDDFIRDYEADTGSGPAELKFSLENNEDVGLEGDIENVCFEMKNRKRLTNADVNVEQAGKDLQDETTRGNGMKRTGWKDRRTMLDWVMMELSFDQIQKITDEFKKANDGISIDDAFADKMSDDINKQTAYKQLLALARGKASYFADEIFTRNKDNQEWSLPFASAVSMLGTLPKADRDKVEEEYKAKNNGVGLVEELDKMVTSSGFEDIIVKICQHYLENLKNRT